jgi:hypothetical protein
MFGMRPVVEPSVLPNDTQRVFVSLMLETEPTRGATLDPERGDPTRRYASGRISLDHARLLRDGLDEVLATAAPRYEAGPVPGALF